MNRRTRIVATLGPATDSPETLRAILLAGVDLVRINFSHGSDGEHIERIARLREIASKMNRNIAVLADLPGPKLRVRIPADRPIEIGEVVQFALGHEPVDPSDIVITEPEMLLDIQPGQRILLDDGRLQMVALERDSAKLHARVTVGGLLQRNKGVNLPDTPLTIPALTDRDREAIGVAVRAGADWIALSFVRHAAAAVAMRDEIAKHTPRFVPILAKMERPEAIENMHSIIATFDGIMVARGDLGVEIPLERVPTAQKRLIAIARSMGKPVITATDMLDSMRQNPRPTRAEAGDVANAIYDGTDAVMLSGETAVGKYPVEAVECMHRIALEAESHLAELGSTRAGELRLEGTSIGDRVTRTVCELAAKLRIDAIVTPTLSGRTARMVARHRPSALVVAPAPDEFAMREMAIVWGLWPVLMDDCKRVGDDRIEGAVRAAFLAGAVQVGQIVLVLAGHPLEGGAGLPTIRLLRVGVDGTQIEP